MTRTVAHEPIELRPVIEVAPYDWSDQKSPESRSPGERLAYFRACMADAGIEGIDPIAAHSNFVEADRVMENELIVRLIREQMSGSGFPGFPSQSGLKETGDPDCVGMLSGGFVLCGGSEVLLGPQCCCDFSNLEDWRKCVNEQPDQGTVWIGHPEAEVSFSEGWVSIAEGWEGESPRIKPKVDHAIRVEALLAAVTNAESHLADIRRRLVTRVQELIGDSERLLAVTNSLMGTS